MLPPSGNAYVFPPFVLIGPLIKFLSTHCHCAFSLVVPDLCTWRYWWPLLRHRSTTSICLGVKGQTDILLFPAPTPSGFAPRPFQWDLWVFRFSDLRVLSCYGFIRKPLDYGKPPNGVRTAITLMTRVFASASSVVSAKTNVRCARLRRLTSTLMPLTDDSILFVLQRLKNLTKNKNLAY